MRRRRVLLPIAGLLILLVAAAVLAAPEALRRLALQRLDAMLAVPVQIEDVDANLATGRLRVTGLVVGDAQAAEPILRVPTLDLDVSYRDLLRGATVVEYVTVHAPRLRVERAADGGINVLQALRPTEGGGRGLAIDWLEIRGGEVHVVDRTEAPPFERTLRNVELRAREVSTLPARVDPASFEVGLRVGEGTITVSGSARPFARPPGVELAATIRALDLALLEPYLPVRVDVSGSRLDADLRYVHAPRAEGPAAHYLEATAASGPARLAPEGGGESVVAVGGLQVDGFRFDFAANRASIAGLTVRAPHVRLRREPDGTLEIARVLGQDRSGAAGGAVSPPAAQPFRLEVRQARLRDGRVDLQDATTAPPVATAVHGLDAVVRDLRLGGEGRPARVSLSGRIGDAASLSAAGTWQPAPVRAALRLDIEGLPIETFGPYANAALGIRTVRRGTVGGQLDVSLGQAPSGEAELSVGGRLVGRGLAFGAPGFADPLLTTRQMVAELERVSLLPTLAADVSRIALAGPGLELRRDEQGRLNVQRLWAAIPGAGGADGAPGPADGPGAGGGPPPPLRIARIELTDGRITYRDAGLEPALTERAVNVRAMLRDLGGSAERTPVSLSGTLGEAPIRFEGWFVPFGAARRFRLEGRLDGYDLSRLHPLPDRLVGHHVRRGRLTLELAYQYDGRRLTGENVVTVRHLELGASSGDRVQEMIGIPLPTVLRLLPRQDGAIRLSVPVSGELTKPEVQVAPLVVDAIRSTLVRSVTAPFRLLGNVLVQGGRIRDLRLAPLPFEPGTVTPVPDGATRLQALVEVLAARPQLGVQVEGRAGSADVPALRRERLEREIAETGRAEPAALRELFEREAGRSTFGPVSETEMRERVLESFTIEDEELAALARARAQFMEQLLLARQVRREQLFIVEPRAEALRTGAPEVALEILD
jgi:hypothetical protein